jgi:hypothetical protein
MNLRHAIALALLCSPAFACAGACGRMADEPASSDNGAKEPANEPPASDPAQPAPAAQDGQCNGQPCAPPNQCVRYAGIAGPSVPLFACGIPCGDNDTCPAGKSCRVIADGPRLCE